MLKIVNIIDKSGSMICMLESAIKGYNGFIESQIHESDTIVSTMLFSSSDNFICVCDNVNIKECDLFNVGNYIPSGGTALLDAIGDVINTEIDWLGTKPLSDRPDKTLCVILTDGEENCSKRYSQEQIKNMISMMKEDFKWEFIFIGANESSIMAENIGVSNGNTYTITANESGIDDAYQCISFVANTYRSSDISENLTDMYKNK